jgi:hypothetical protein
MRNLNESKIYVTFQDNINVVLCMNNDDHF